MSRCGPWLGYAILTLVFCRPIFSGRLLFSGGDALHSIYSSMVYFHEWAGQGTVPLWNTLSACGAPFGASSISITNLYYCGAKFFEAGTAYNAVMVLSILLNGIFLYEFLVRTGRSSFAAWVGGLIWMTSTAKAIDSGFFAFACSLLMADIFSSKRSGTTLIFFVLSLAFYALNAHPQYFLYGTLFLWGYLIYRWKGKTQGGPALVASNFVPFLIALGLYGVHATRLVEWMSQSNRSAWTLVQAWLPTHYPLVIFPNLYQIAGRADLDFIVPRVFQWAFSHQPSLKALERVLEPPYVGLWPLFGVLVAAHHLKQRRGHDRFFLVALAVVVLYLLLHPILYPLMLHSVPVLSGMTNIGRLFEIYQLSLAVLASMAVDFLIRNDKESTHFFKRTNRRVLIGLGLFILSLGIVRIFSYQQEGFLRHKIESSLRALSTPTIFIENVAQFQNQRADEFFFFIRQLTSPANPHVLIPMVLLLTMMAIIYAYQSKRISREVFKVLTLLFILTDLGTALGFEMRSSDPAEIEKDQGILRLFSQDKELFRVMMLEDKTRSFSKFFLVPQSNMIYGVATPDGYEPLYIRRYVDFYSWLTRRGSYPVGFVMHPMHDFDPHLANFINVKYILTTVNNRNLDGRLGFTNVFEDKEYRVYRNDRALPRAFFVPKAHWAVDLKSAEEYIRAFPERLSQEVVLIGPTGEMTSSQSPPGPMSGYVHIDLYEPNRIEISVKADRPGYLVVSDTYYPGWRAWVDGKAQEILPANYAFRSISMAEGEHKVTFRYRPRSLSMGLALSLGAIFVLLIVSKYYP